MRLESSDEALKTHNRLEKMGIDVLRTCDFQKNHEKYLEYVRTLKFAKDWTPDSIKEFLSNPVTFGMVMVCLGDADCIVSGATTPSSEVIRNSIRIIGVGAFNASIDDERLNNISEKYNYNDTCKKHTCASFNCSFVFYF